MATTNKRKSESFLNNLLQNDKVVLLLSFILAIVIWVAVVLNVSPEESRVIQDVKVTIDNTVPSQFGLEVFGEKEFYVDVTVSGKKYQISPAALSAKDIVVTAQTNSVDAAGMRTLQLKAEPASGGPEFTISSLSEKTVEVYFDTAKSVQMVIEPDVVVDGFDLVKPGYTTGDINLSETSVTISGPATEVNAVERVVARIQLDAPLSSNKSADAELVAENSTGKSSFRYLTMSLNFVVLTIPVLQVKEVGAIVTFKNAPDNYVLTPLKYSISPSKDLFRILVEEYDKTDTVSVGTIDFKNLSPSNHVFTFPTENTMLSKDSDTKEFRVDVDVSALSQEYFTVPKASIRVDNPNKLNYSISGLNKSVVVVGTKTALADVTLKDITVSVDLSDVEIREGQSLAVPADVAVKSAGCWVYGTYTVEISR